MENVHQLLEVAGQFERLAILTHNNPDPDAIATAVVLQYILEQTLGLQSQIFYQGIIGRAENKALARYLKNPLKRVSQRELASADVFALVDTQPGTGNNALPLKSKVAVVIDHHPWQSRSAAANFVDVRPDVGAASSILTEYVKSLDLELPPRLASALFYGIKTDTMGLGRGISPLDIDAICYLLRRADLKMLLRVERAQVPLEYFQSLAGTLQASRIYNHVLVSYIGEMHYPDLAAEMADLFLRMKGCQWVLCMGVYQDRLFLSIRTQKQRGAGELIQKIVGSRGVAGGHGAMAGGQVILNGQDPAQLAQTFTEQALKQLHIPPHTKGLTLDEA